MTGQAAVCRVRATATGGLSVSHSGIRSDLIRAAAWPVQKMAAPSPEPPSFLGSEGEIHDRNRLRGGRPGPVGPHRFVDPDPRLADRLMALDPELGDLTQITRAELEPAMAKMAATGETSRADVVWAELAVRVWQHCNPY